MARTALLNVMVNAALKAGRGLARDFGEVENLQVSMKGPGDFVSAADRRAEQVIIGELRKARPAYAILAEESGAAEGTDPSHRWIIDPLDGTLNFLHGVPLFAISIGLEREGVMVAGVIYNPVMNELYAAERGSGAFLNDRRLRVARRSALADSMISMGFPPPAKADPEREMKEFAKLKAGAASVRRTGSAAMDLAWTASGRFDGYWHQCLNSWDMAGGIIIAREAGAIVTDTEGGLDMFKTGSIAVGNEQIHKAMLARLSSAS